MERRAHIIYEGHVQGVGFRFTVQDLARNFQVKGYVKNLPDLTVELLVEGEEKEIHDFLKAISDSRLMRFIAEQKISWSESQDAFSDFQIGY